MPIYTIYHRPLIQGKSREELAIGLTDLHANVTGASRDDVKIIFAPLDAYSFFKGGKPTQSYVRVVAQIRIGRTEEQKMQILSGMYKLVKAAFDQKPPRFVSSWSGQKHEEFIAETQIVEIDDTKTVMTNGVLNT